MAARHEIEHAAYTLSPEGANFSKGSSVRGLGHRHLRNGSRESGSSIVVDLGRRNDGARQHFEGSRREEGVGAVQVRKQHLGPLRWNRKVGEPTCLLEWIVQHTWLLVPYIALVVTLLLVTQMVGLK